MASQIFHTHEAYDMNIEQQAFIYTGTQRNFKLKHFCNRRFAFWEFYRHQRAHFKTQLWSKGRIWGAFGHRLALLVGKV